MRLYHAAPATASDHPSVCGRPHLACVRLLHPQHPDRLADLNVCRQHRLGQLADLPDCELYASMTSPTSSSIRVTSRDNSMCLDWMTEVGIRPLPGREPR
eukprot:6210027-Pleurochrysis_carterae.AAC.1